MKAINQEKSKIDVLDNLTAEQVLVVMDWAMKWRSGLAKRVSAGMCQPALQKWKKMKLSPRYLPFYVCKSGF